MSLTRILPPRFLSTRIRGFATTAPKHEAGGMKAIIAQLNPSNMHNRPVYGHSQMGPGPKNLVNTARASLETEEQYADMVQRAAYQKHVYRRWHPGDVYAPHDLSGTEQNKWRISRNAPRSDAFATLGINPINEYKNFTMLSEYMTDTGRIRHSKATGLRPKNQRKIAKAIRRAVGLGLMPSVHRHPLVLKSLGPGRFFS